MARPHRRAEEAKGPIDAGGQAPQPATPAGPGANGAGGGGDCYLFLLREGDEATKKAIELIHDRIGLKFTSTADAPDDPVPPAQQGVSGRLLHQLGVAFAVLDVDEVAKFDELPKDGPILLFRQEGAMAALAAPPAVLLPSPDYAAGYQDAVNQFLDRAVPPAVEAPTLSAPAAVGGALPPPPPPSLDYLRGYRDGVAQITARFGAGTAGPRAVPQLGLPAAARGGAGGRARESAQWGLEVTGALTSGFTGRGVAVAILDTGLGPREDKFKHPDFQDGRVKARVSFVPGEDGCDDHGHGTQVAGIVGGPNKPAQGPRYGVACEADLYVGKVLDRAGRGSDWMVLSGLNWALTKKCQVVALPFGMVPRGPRPEAFYREVGRRAAVQGALLVAAAGGHSNRSRGNVQPVAVPANVGSILGVGAVDHALAVANFSNGAVLKSQGGVDLVGPGVNVRSSAPMPIQTVPASGTSAAAAYVAGVAALLAESLNKKDEPCAAAEVLHALLLTARPLHLPSSDVGKGLVQAPQGRYG